MNTFLVIFNIVVWTLFLGITAYRRYGARFFPKYVAWRAVRKNERAERSLVKYREKLAADKARLKSWAEGNPQDPLARAYLTQEESSASPEDADELDPAAELRRRQREEDDYQQRRENRRVTEELLSQRLLDWATDNPTIPEARRHLEEQIEKTSDQLESTHREVRHCESILKFAEDMTPDDDPETILFRTRLAEAKAKMVNEQQFIHRIHTALEVPLPDVSQ